MQTQYGLPLFLEDATACLSATTYSDLYDRAHYSLQTLTRPDRIVISSTLPSSGRRNRSASNASLTNPGRRRRASSAAVPTECVINLPPGAFGKATVTFGGSVVPIDAYMQRVPGSSSRSESRRFMGSDSASYTWTLSKTTKSWTCNNQDGLPVAEYAEYSSKEKAVTRSNSAAMLTVEEQWSWMAVELLATLTIVRYIAKNKL